MCAWGADKIALNRDETAGKALSPSQLLPNVGVPKILLTGNSPFSDAF